MPQPTSGRRYKIAELLGKGGFGSVYRAEMLGEGGFSKPVALKILNASVEGFDDVVRRLRDEARMLGLLRHRAIVQVDDLVVLDGRWTIVMELIEGLDLRTLLTAGTVPPGPALEVVQEVAAALHVAYDRPTSRGEVLKLLHRDIKPANIQLTGDGEVKVLDFGTARADFEGREAETHSLMYGTVPYMAPERLDFVDTPGGDIYALGTVLFELLTGEALGKTSANEKRHAALVEKAVVRLATASVDAEISDFVIRALAFDPADRPTAQEFERRARQLGARFPVPSLQDFAEQRVRPYLTRRRTTSDPLVGRVLTQDPSGGQRPDHQPSVEPEPDSSGTTWQRKEHPAPVIPAPSAATEQGTVPKQSRAKVAAGVGGCGGLALTVTAAVFVLLTLGVAVLVAWRVGERPWRVEFHEPPVTIVPPPKVTVEPPDPDTDAPRAPLPADPPKQSLAKSPTPGVTETRATEPVQAGRRGSPPSPEPESKPPPAPVVPTSGTGAARIVCQRQEDPVPCAISGATLGSGRSIPAEQLEWSNLKPGQYSLTVLFEKPPRTHTGVTFIRVGETRVLVCSNESASCQ